MKYLNGLASLVREAKFLRATPPQRAVWFCLWAYCHEQNNSGNIDFPETWTDAMWQGIQVDPAIVKEPSPLWNIGSTRLTVCFYNKKAEQDYLKKIAMGSEYSLRRWKKRAEPKPKKHGSPNGSPIGSPNGSANAYVGKEVCIPPKPAAANPPTPPPDGICSTASRKKPRTPFQRPQ